MLCANTDQNFLQKLAGWKGTKNAVTDAIKQLDDVVALFELALIMDNNVTVRELKQGQEKLLRVADEAASKMAKHNMQNMQNRHAPPLTLGFGG